MKICFHFLLQPYFHNSWIIMFFGFSKNEWSQITYFKILKTFLYQSMQKLNIIMICFHWIIDKFLYTKASTPWTTYDWMKCGHTGCMQIVQAAIKSVFKILYQFSRYIVFATKNKAFHIVDIPPTIIERGKLFNALKMPLHIDWNRYASNW